MRNFFFIILFHLVTLAATAQTIGIAGTAPDYAGVTLRFYTYSDYITYEEELVLTCTTDVQGRYAGAGTLTHEGLVFVRAGIYFLYFYAIPGADYTLHWPPRQDKTPTDSLNPFFEEVPLHIGAHTTAATDINRLMMEGDCNPNANAQYEAYCRYREGMEKYRSIKQKVKKLSENYFRNRPILYHNEAYMDLFNQVYGRYFEFAQRENASLAGLINQRKGLSELKTYMLRDSTFHDDALLELVLLKNLYDNFYTNSFSREGLLSLVKEIEAATPYVEHKRIAQNIIQKVTLLMPGYAPPDFALYSTDGKLYHLSDFRGKALYLIFCRVFNYSVLNAFEKLVILHNIYGDAVEIAVISADDDFSSLKDFCTRERYRWPFLHYGNDPEVLKRYDIKALPTYFILDKDGKLMLSPAPSPLDDLEGLFMEIHAQAHRQ